MSITVGVAVEEAVGGVFNFPLGFWWDLGRTKDMISNLGFRPRWDLLVRESHGL